MKMPDCKSSEEHCGSDGLLGRLVWSLAVALLTACGTSSSGKQESDFFTSGSREADQRASQKMTRADQLAGSNEDGGGGRGSSDLPATDPQKQSLFERLGGTPGISNIVEDFLPRALNDPRVNWQRTGIEKGGLFTPNKSVEWAATGEEVKALKLHLIQFISLASGGPSRYEGGDMKATHADMKITNSEFDAAIGDLKASLDNLSIRDREQKELLSIMESTRPQIVTER